MFNHVSIGTRDLERAARFYDAALGALGYRRTMSEDFGCAWGLEWPEFWATQPDEGDAGAGNGTHVAFIAPSRAAVETSSSSPTPWPKRSLTALKPSRSQNRMA